MTIYPMTIFSYATVTCLFLMKKYAEQKWDQFSKKIFITPPGALHHIVCRGIEQRNIFRDNTGQDRFLKRLNSVLTESTTPCYAWALIQPAFSAAFKNRQ